MKFNNTTELVRKVFALARPYGRKKLLLVSGLSFVQGLFQVLGVTSIFPFLALAADPDRLRNSRFGQRFLEWVPPMDNASLLIFAGCFAIFMLCIANGTNLLAEFIRTRYVHNFGHWLRVRLLNRIVSQPYAYFLESNSAVLIKKVTGDVSQYTTGVLLPLLDSLARLVTITLLVGTLFLVHPQIALAATVGLAIFYLLLFRLFGRWRRKTTVGLRDAQRGAMVAIHQLLGGIKTIKVHGAEPAFLQRFRDHSQHQARLMAWVAVVGNGPRYLIEPLAFGGLVIVVLLYASRGQDLTAVLPNLGVMALAGYRLLPALQLLYAQMNQLGTMRHTLDEVYDELQTVEETKGHDSGAAEGRFPSPSRLQWSHAITLDNLTFQYPGASRPVIVNLNLTIPKNTSLGIVGTTGCGKSTLVDLLLGLHLPTAGQIWLDDISLTQDNRRAWRAGIGYVPQDIYLLDDTLAANIAFAVAPGQIDLAALERAARAAQILEFIQNEAPHSWSTIVGERGVRLSGGQRQRIGLARALYHNPDLLILDEATSALDPDTETEVINAIAELSHQLTMIVVAHRLRTVQICDAKLDLSKNDPIALPLAAL